MYRTCLAFLLTGKNNKIILESNEEKFNNDRSKLTNVQLLKII